MEPAEELRILREKARNGQHSMRQLRRIEELAEEVEVEAEGGDMRQSNIA